MKDKIESFIFTSLDKLDTTSIILLIPVFALLYVVIFVDIDELTDAFSSDHKYRKIDENIEIVCPHCGESYIFEHKYIIDK